MLATKIGKLYGVEVQATEVIELDHILWVLKDDEGVRAEGVYKSLRKFKSELTRLGFKLKSFCIEDH